MNSSLMEVRGLHKLPGHGVLGLTGAVSASWVASASLEQLSGNDGNKGETVNKQNPPLCK